MKEKLISLCTILLVAGCGGNDVAVDSVVESESVRIVRDDWGVPHIYADSIYGLYYGYGYSIAQDRLFQLEMARRSTQSSPSAMPSHSARVRRAAWRRGRTPARKSSSSA